MCPPVRPSARPGPTSGSTGRIYFAVDPKNPVNQIIADIDKAPRNAAGKVEFSSDFELLKPKDPSRGNGTVLYEVSNRGGRGMVNFFNRGNGQVDPQTGQRTGDDFLFDQGFTLMWIGWQFDVPQRPELLRVYAPIAKEADGRAHHGARAKRLRRDPTGARSLARRSQSPGISGFRSQRSRDQADGARFGRGRAPHDSARPVAVHRRWQERAHGGRLRTEEDL